MVRRNLYVGKQHVRFGEEEVASAVAPRRERRLYKGLVLLFTMLCAMMVFGDTPGLTANVGRYTYTFTLLDGLTAAITGCSPEPEQDLVIPSMLTINEEVEKIKSVSVSSVEEGCFANCTKLTSVVFPNSSYFFHIRANAFNGCVALTNIVMHEGLASIGDRAFGGCSNVTEVVVPKSVESMGEAVFTGCSGIKSIVLPFVGAGADLPVSVRWEKKSSDTFLGKRHLKVA